MKRRIFNVILTYIGLAGIFFSCNESDHSHINFVGVVMMAGALFCYMWFGRKHYRG